MARGRVNSEYDEYAMGLCGFGTIMAGIKGGASSIPIMTEVCAWKGCF